MEVNDGDAGTEKNIQQEVKSDIREELADLMRQAMSELGLLRPDSEVTKKLETAIEKLKTADVSELPNTVADTDEEKQTDPTEIQLLVELASGYETEVKELRERNREFENEVEDLKSQLERSETKAAELYEIKLNQLTTDYVALNSLHVLEMKKVEELSDKIRQSEDTVHDKDKQLNQLEYNLAFFFLRPIFRPMKTTKLRN